MSSTKQHTSRIALVTGASRGLGAAIAVGLAARGITVAVNYCHNQAGAEAVVAKIAAAGGSAAAFQADVTDPAAVRILVEQVETRLGSPTILVNNATGPQPFIRLEQQQWDDYQAQIDFFLKAPFLLMQNVLPAMKRNGFGRVIHIGSEVAELGNAEFSHYAAAKAGMLGLTRSWASELGSMGITVNLVAPGWIPVERHEGTAPSALDAYREKVPLKRMGNPNEVADAVAFLASPDSAFITGQRIAVNGGNTFG